MAHPRVFDAEGMAAAGLGLVSREGWTALSVRSVAAELGVSPMALYRLAPDAACLRRLIADAAASPLRPVAQKSLPDTLRCWAVDTYAHLRRYPGLGSYLVLRWTELPGWLDIVEALLASSNVAGHTGPEAVASVNAVFAYVLVRAQLHDAATNAPRRRLAPLSDDPRRYPLLRRNRAEFAKAQSNRHFAFGLDLLIAGLGTREIS